MVSNPIGTKFKSMSQSKKMSQSRVSNPIGTKFKYKSGISRKESDTFQIPQGQSSNMLRDAINDFFLRFKSHRDKVQIALMALKTVSSPGFKSHRDKVQILDRSQTPNLLQSFKSHRDKVQISKGYEVCKLLLVSNPIGTKFKWWTAEQLINVIEFQIPQGQSSNYLLFYQFSLCLCVSNPIGTKFK